MNASPKASGEYICFNLKDLNSELEKLTQGSESERQLYNQDTARSKSRKKRSQGRNAHSPAEAEDQRSPRGRNERSPSRDRLSTRDHAGQDQSLRRSGDSRSPSSRCARSPGGIEKRSSRRSSKVSSRDRSPFTDEESWIDPRVVLDSGARRSNGRRKEEIRRQEEYDGYNARSPKRVCKQCRAQEKESRMIKPPEKPYTSPQRKEGKDKPLCPKLCPRVKDKDFFEKAFDKVVGKPQCHKSNQSKRMSDYDCDLLGPPQAQSTSTRSKSRPSRSESPRGSTRRRHHKQDQSDSELSQSSQESMSPRNHSSRKRSTSVKATRPEKYTDGDHHTAQGQLSRCPKKRRLSLSSSPERQTVKGKKRLETVSESESEIRLNNEPPRARQRRCHSRQMSEKSDYSSEEEIDQRGKQRKRKMVDKTKQPQNQNKDEPKTSRVNSSDKRDRSHRNRSKSDRSGKESSICDSSFGCDCQIDPSGRHPNMIITCDCEKQADKEVRQHVKPAHRHLKKRENRRDKSDDWRDKSDYSSEEEMDKKGKQWNGKMVDKTKQPQNQYKDEPRTSRVNSSDRRDGSKRRDFSEEGDNSKRNRSGNDRSGKEPSICDSSFGCACQRNGHQPNMVITCDCEKQSDKDVRQHVQPTHRHIQKRDNRRDKSHKWSEDNLQTSSSSKDVSPQRESPQHRREKSSSNPAKRYKEAALYIKPDQLSPTDHCLRDGQISLTLSMAKFFGKGKRHRSADRKGTEKAAKSRQSSSESYLCEDCKEKVSKQAKNDRPPRDRGERQRDETSSETLGCLNQKEMEFALTVLDKHRCNFSNGAKKLESDKRSFLPLSDSGSPVEAARKKKKGDVTRKNSRLEIMLCKLDPKDHK